MSSTFAEEGTTAHALAELKLRDFFKQIKKKDLNPALKHIRQSEYYNQEMEDATDAYVTAVVERYMENKKLCPDPIIIIEEKVSFAEWVPEGYGTADAIIIADGMLEIFDLKYGKGIPVYADDNPQMKLYALGAFWGYGHLYDVDSVAMNIIQPRLDNISSAMESVSGLMQWAVDVVVPAAELAWNGEGEYKAGDHCKFCKIKATCRQRAEENLELAKYDFADPAVLSIQEVADILGKAEELQAWAKDIQAWALEQAERHGVEFPGWKLVEGRSNRKYTDEELVAAELIKSGMSEDEVYNKKIKGITDMEKALGKKKFAELLKDLVIKPAGKPTLVTLGDKRPAISSTDSAVNDFK